MSLVTLATESTAIVARGTVAAPAAPQPQPGADALNALVRYIPTEVITLYVAALGAKAASPFWLWVAGAVATPIVLALLIMGKAPVGQRRDALKNAARWPMWAATIAFIVWALAVPDSVLPPNDRSRVLASLGAVVISSLLSLLDPILRRS